MRWVSGKWKMNGYEALEFIQSVVDEQANDEGLWFINPMTAPEAYLQSELRRLHRVIEAAQGDES